MRHKGPISLAIDTSGQTSAFLLTAHRDEAAAKRFLSKAIRRHGMPATATIDGREAHATAMRRYHKVHSPASAIRQSKSLTNLITQDQRTVQRVTRSRGHSPGANGDP